MLLSGKSHTRSYGPSSNTATFTAWPGIAAAIQEVCALHLAASVAMVLMLRLHAQQALVG